MRTFILLALFVAPAATQAQSLPQATDFLRNTYNLETKIDSLGVPDAQVYTPSLLRLMHHAVHKAGNAGMLDDDPLCSCQNAADAKFTILSLTGTPAKAAHASVRLNFPDKSEQTIDLDMEWTKAGWRIADVRTARMPSLRKLLLTK